MYAVHNVRDGAGQHSLQEHRPPSVLSESVAEVHDRLLAWAARPEGAIPVADVLACYHAFGKHFVPLSLLQALDAARATCLARSEDPAVVQLLDCALDKLDGTYSYRTYLGLPLLTSARPPRRVGGAGTDALLTMLMADLVRHEVRPRDHTEPLRLMVPPPELSFKRARLAMRVLVPALDRLAERHPAGAALAERARQLAAARTDDPTEALSLATEIWELFTESDRQRVTMSLLPVYVVDDEYLFIRTLQAYELVFMELAACTADAVEAVLARRITDATRLMRGCAAMLREARPLFSLQATMRAEAFLKFRGYTLGSSAIQSEGYKAFEALFARPDTARLDSPAFASVPRIKQMVSQGGVGLLEVMGSAAASPGADEHLGRTLAELRTVLVEVDEIHQQWKRTHLRIASRMIGDEPGSGNTDGVAYLRAVMDKKVFSKEPS
jgi:tryptophan 2,3-dioxygenase